MTERLQKITSYGKKTPTWALYDKKQFQVLIDELDYFVNGLIELFPAAIKEQHKISEREVEEFATIDQGTRLPLLKYLIGVYDSILLGAVDKKLLGLIMGQRRMLGGTVGRQGRIEGYGE